MPVLSFVTRFLAASALLVSMPVMAQVDGAYDLGHEFTNPLRQAPSACSACVDFFRVNRPLAPLVNHVFVGTRLRYYCEDASLQPGKTALIYGGVKGRSDEASLELFLADTVSHHSNLDYRGTACGEDALRALDVAVDVSRSRAEFWQKYPVVGAVRIVATPLLGRPCDVAAAAVLDAVQPFLKFAD